MKSKHFFILFKNFEIDCSSKRNDIFIVLHFFISGDQIFGQHCSGGGGGKGGKKSEVKFLAVYFG